MMIQQGRMDALTVVSSLFDAALPGPQVGDVFVLFMKSVSIITTVEAPHVSV